MSGAAGLKPGEIRNMDYSRGRIDFEVRPTSTLCEDGGMADSRGCGPDTEPDGIKVRDTVTIVRETA